jgi:hypothetical protein
MNETLGERVHREFCWFARVLVALLIVFAAERLVPGALVSNSNGGDKAVGAAQPGTRP